MRGYKVFDSERECRGFRYEVGKIYTMEESPKCCERGFHFCTKLVDCFRYYDFNQNNKVAEIEAFGEIDCNDEDTKACTNGIRIVRELTWGEVLELVNIGKRCSGMRNSGDWNSGDCNSGDWNSGDCNSGNKNSGDWNRTNFSSGIFNTEEQKIRMFNKESDWTYGDWRKCRAKGILARAPHAVVKWVDKSNMTNEEEKAYPDYETTGGYLKVQDERDAITNWWNELSADNKKTIKSLPNFDWDIFCECTGIDKERANV